MPKAEATILGPTSQPFPRPVYPSVVQIKETFDGDWQFEPELFMTRCSQCTAGHDLSSAEVVYRYGRIKQPWESAPATKTAGPSVTGWWVRICLIGDNGLHEIFVGRFSGEARDVQGSDTVDRGTRTFVAYGPEDILRKIHVSRSYWRNAGNGGPLEIGWVPGVNQRDERGLIAGNRSHVHQSGGASDWTYTYGGGEGLFSPLTWSNKDYAEYILDRFASTEDVRWTLGGQADLLDEITEVHPMGVTQSVADVLRMLISTRKGLDYRVVSSKKGFEIRVFALASKAWSFAGVTLPTNPQEVTIRPTETKDVVSATLVRSSDQQYGKIRVLGARAIIAFSLYGESAPFQPDPSAAAGSGENVLALEPKWADADESAYKDASYDQPSDATAPYPSAEGHDEVRREDRFRDVYRKFALPAGQTIACPVLDAMGDYWDGARDDEMADAQPDVRRTLSWLPMWTNVDYSGGWPIDNNGEDELPELMRPVVWICRPNSSASFWHSERYHYMPAEERGLSVSVLENDVGILLGSAHNHIMAHSHFVAWSAEFPANAAPTDRITQYDYNELIATLAIESDQRLVLEYKAEGWTELDGTLEIVDEDAELWMMRPYTCLGYDGAELVAPDTWMELRSDHERLAFTMAGALARYSVDRCRGSIAVRGLSPWGDLIGQILTAVDAGDGLQQVQSAITAVEWIGGNYPQTIVRTGFAQ